MSALPLPTPVPSTITAAPPAIPLSDPVLHAYRNAALAPLSQTARHLLCQLVTHHPPRPDVCLRLSVAQLCQLAGRGRTQTYSAVADLACHGFLDAPRLGRTPLLRYGPSVFAPAPSPSLAPANTLSFAGDARPVLAWPGCRPDIRISGFPDGRTKAVSQLVKRTAVSDFSTAARHGSSGHGPDTVPAVPFASPRTPEGALFQTALVTPWPDTLDTAHHWPTERQRLREAAERNRAWQSDREDAIYQIAVGLLAWACCTARQIASGRQVKEPVGYTYSPWARGRTPPSEDHTAAKQAWTAANQGA